MEGFGRNKSGFVYIIPLVFWFICICQETCALKGKKSRVCHRIPPREHLLAISESPFGHENDSQHHEYRIINQKIPIEEYTPGIFTLGKPRMYRITSNVVERELSLFSRIR